MEFGSRLDRDGKTERSPSVGSRLTAWEVWADRIKPKLLQLKEAKGVRAFCWLLRSRVLRGLDSGRQDVLSFDSAV
jgi:hypothetical protein